MRRLVPVLLGCLFLASASSAEPDPGLSLGASVVPPPGAPVAPVAPPPPGAPATTHASDLERVLSAVARDEQRAEERFAALGREAALAHAQSIVRGRAYVRLARAGLLPVGGGLNGLLEHAAKLERLRRGLEQNLATQRVASKARAELAQRLEELRARRTRLDGEWQAVRRAESELLAAADRQRAFDRAFNSSGGGDYTAVYGAAGPGDPGALLRGFAVQKGRLPFPIAGRTEVKSARRSGARGVELSAPLGTPVRAVYPGRVAFADDYADYGKAVIIDHGDQYYTVSGSLGSVDVEVGDELSANDRIGTVGNAGHGAVVYFEIRAGAATVDPAPWLGI